MSAGTRSIFMTAAAIALWLAQAAIAAEPNSEHRPPPAAPKLPTPPEAAPNTPYSCSYCDLQKLDLSGRDLTDANLAGADLRGANLKGAQLSGTVLIGANLEGADLSGARFDASASGPSDLSRASLAGASLRGAGMHAAVLHFANLQGTDFTGADLSGAKFDPVLRAGRYAGRLTSFHGAKVKRGFRVDAEKMDVSGVQWVESLRATLPPVTPAGISCGNSDVSSLTSIVYVSSTGTDSGTCGAGPSGAQACKTIGYSLSRCSGQTCNLLVMYGEYDLPQTLQLGLSTPPILGIYGGCLPQSEADPTYMSAIVSPGNGAPAITLDVNGQLHVENLKVLGSAASGSQAAPATTIGLSNGATFSANNSVIVGGTGATGATGGGAAPGNGGGSGNWQTAGTNGSCPNSNGGVGAGQMSMHISGVDCDIGCDSNGCWGVSGGAGDTGNWAAAGGPGTAYSTFCPPTSAPGGGGAGSGDNASCGSGGPASTNLQGSFNGATWSAGTGGNGTPGLDGGGGGGGGSGAAVCGVCIFVPWDYWGNAGGGGGAGGCGGGNGGGGQQGGGSFALVAAASTVTLNQTRVIAGRGGDGGPGGPGGNGGTGGGYGAGTGSTGSGYHGGGGGNGGIGGSGGGGGGGAGGNGGPSIGVALVSGGTVTGTGLVYYAGNSGGVGNPGTGGTALACTVGPAGASGVPGLVSNTASY